MAPCVSIDTSGFNVRIRTYEMQRLCSEKSHKKEVVQFTRTSKQTRGSFYDGQFVQVREASFGKIEAHYFLKKLNLTFSATRPAHVRTAPHFRSSTERTALQCVFEKTKL